MQTPVDEIRQNSWLFDEFLTEMKLRRHFREFSRHVLFWTARTFGDKFLDGVNATRNFERKFVLCGEFSGRKFVVLFILLKKIWLNLWLVTTLCNTPIKFPATIPVSARPIEILHKQGLHPAEILKALKHEGLLVSFSSITRIIKKLRLTGSVANLPRSGRPQKLSTEAKTFVDQQMRRDDETTSNTIKKKLERHGICVSASTVRRARKQQGWTLQRTAYCQLIRDANKVKRLEFAQRVLESGDTFNNVIFSDECSISLQAYRRTCF